MRIAAARIAPATAAALILASVGCNRPAGGDSQRQSFVEEPASASARAASPPASSVAKSGTGFDESLFAAVPTGTIAGQILDHGDRAQKDAIVYVKEGARATKYPAQPPVTVNQRDKTFQPRIFPVLVGTKVSFKNSDMVLHNVYSRSLVKTFDLGAFSHDEARDATFDAPGRVDVFCAIHTNMHAIVLVLDNPFFASTDARGYFEIRNLPVGSYTLRIWREHGEEQQALVETAADRGAILRTKLP